MDPQSTLNHLSGLDYRIIEQIDFLSRLQAKKSPTGARYCNPGQAWLARTLGRSRQTINVRIRRLYHLGILSVTHRRKVEGRWQTNLYKIVQYTGWGWARVHNLLTTLRNRVKKARHIASPPKGDNKENTQKLPKEEAQRLFKDLYAAVNRRKS